MSMRETLSQRTVLLAIMPEASCPLYHTHMHKYKRGKKKKTSFRETVRPKQSLVSSQSLGEGALSEPRDSTALPYCNPGFPAVGDQSVATLASEILLDFEAVFEPLYSFSCRWQLSRAPSMEIR